MILDLPSVWRDAEIRAHYLFDCIDPVEITAFGETRKSYVCGLDCVDPVQGHTVMALAHAEVERDTTVVE